jgi:hypothetical protein
MAVGGKRHARDARARGRSYGAALFGTEEQKDLTL